MPDKRQWIRHLLFAFPIVLSGLTPALAQDITVFAAASLKTALDEIAELYQAQTNQRVRPVYAGSSALARQIEFGAPADIFISANTAWMTYLEDRGSLREETRVDLLGNALVLVGTAPQDPLGDIGPDTDIRSVLQGGRLALALTDAVPAGIYAKAALEHFGQWRNLAPLVAETDNVRAALALVTVGAAPAAIVYASDAKAEPRVTVIGHFPADSHPEIVYPAALTATATPEAMEFLDYLRSAPAHDVFESNGFAVIAE
jgi:molybdate transport system substrate-binding protein